MIQPIVQIETGRRKPNQNYVWASFRLQTARFPVFVGAAKCSTWNILQTSITLDWSGSRWFAENYWIVATFSQQCLGTCGRNHQCATTSLSHRAPRDGHLGFQVGAVAALKHLLHAASIQLQAPFQHVHQVAYELAGFQ